MKENRPQSRKENLVEQEVDGELLIYDLQRDRALCLNKTSALVWQACDGTRTIAELNDHLGKHLNAQTDEDIVWLALDQLSREKLIDQSVGFKSKFEGMSRREVIRKIGFGSVVALPVVASLVAPSALMAQSQGICIMALDACTPPSPGMCCSMTCISDICCAGSGIIQNGGNAGAPVGLVSPGGCLFGAPIGDRNAACDNLRGDNCCSGNAALTLFSCVPAPGGQIDFMCTCVA